MVLLSPLAGAEQLLVFVQKGASPLQASFLQEHLPAIETLAGDLGIPVEVVDLAATGAAPAEVKITPLLVFQDWRGRSVYQGRYATPDRITNFLRTARAMLQGDAALVREDLPVTSVGRATVAVPLKITGLAGPGAESADRGGFDPAAAAVRGLSGFEHAERVELGRADRLWYANFYPYADADGGFAVSGELYSQFHCHEPVWTSFEDPATAATPAAAMEAAADALAGELRRQLAQSELGDGFDPVPLGFAASSFESLGFPLPERPAGVSAEAAEGVELGNDWVVVADPVAAASPVPPVGFAFPAPLDAYAGEATGLSGSLELASTDTVVGLTGRIAVDPATVTMGEDDLDDWIHSGVLKVEEHPEAFFEIERVEPGSDPGLAFGRFTPLTLHGTFTMKGLGVPLSIPAQVEATVGPEGGARLRLEASWTLGIAEPFGIEGPPGDEEASSKLRFTSRIVFEPASRK